MNTLTALKPVETLNKTPAEKATHLDIVDIVERRIEAAEIVFHFKQIGNIDDILLINLSEVTVEVKNGVVGDTALQFDGFFSTATITSHDLRS